MVLQPFMSTRNFCFNEQGTLMFAISATSGLLIVYNIFSEKEECRIKVKDLLMSLRVKGKNILVTSQKCVYYYTLEKVNKSYQIFERNKFNSPENSGSIVLEAVLFKKWVICLGQKKFKANLLDDKKFKQVTW